MERQESGKVLEGPEPSRPMPIDGTFPVLVVVGVVSPPDTEFWLRQRQRGSRGAIPANPPSSR